MCARPLPADAAPRIPFGGRADGKNKIYHYYTAEYSEFSDDGTPAVS